MLIPQTEVVITANGAEIGRYTVTPGEYVIGREGDIPVEADLVSRRHALLTVNYAEWLIEDLGSTNGTLLSGQRVAGATRVWPSQKIQLGAATIELHRLQTQPTDGESVGPQAASVRRYLPPEFLRGSKYAIERRIAQGGMGAILAAQEAGLRRPVAMKVMLESGSEGDLVRFIEEAQITGQLQHPNIVPVYELGVDEHEQVFYTMKLVEGITLKKVLELLRAEIPATVEKYLLNTLLTIFLKVCDALAFAHAKRVIHRDLKPENIMLGSFGEVLVMDWGLAKVIGTSDAPGRSVTRVRSVVLSSRDAGAASTLAGTIMGTPHFMAPEQAAGKVDQLDARSDIFSLGAILYQILTLDLPFQGRTIDEVLASVRRCEPMPPQRAAIARATRDKSKTKPEVPAALAAVAMKALSPRPDDRYQSVTELQREIEAYQGGFATRAEKAGAWKQAGLFIRRNKAASIGVAAVLLIGGVFGTKAVVEGRRATRALAELRGTAPTFAAQAAALVEAQKFDDALEKLSFAIRLDPDNADYHLARANTLQAQSRLREAAESYRRVLALRDGDAAAKTNLEICEKLLAESGGGKLTLQQKNKLLDAILAQKRQADAVPLSRELKRDTDTAETTIKTRLKAIMAQPNWKPDKLKRQPNGTFSLDLTGVKISDLAVLEGMPISSLTLVGSEPVDIGPLQNVPLTWLNLGNRPVTDLSSLKGLKLRSLELSGTKVTDLSPLVGMPLEKLLLNGTKVSDLAPLRGLPLKQLDLTDSAVTDLGPLKDAPLEMLTMNRTKISDLTPLHGMLLKKLDITTTRISNLAPLRGMPLRQLDAAATDVRDLRPLSESPIELLTLSDCIKLESLDGVQKMPLASQLNIGHTPVADLSPLRGSTVKTLWMDRCDRIRDLAPLMDCKQLEAVTLPTHNSDLAFLKKHPALKRLSQQPIADFGYSLSRVTPAEEFWKKNGERLARQVPMEKQLEKFRQSLIAQGNEPAKVPRFAFDTEGQLFINLSNNVKVSDLTELRGVAVTKFVANSSSLRDISPLAGASLRELTLFPDCKVTDISALRGAPLEILYLDVAPVRDISVVRGMPLRIAFFKDCPITDVSPLAGIPTLERVLLPRDAKNIETLRTHPKIALISFVWDTPRQIPNRTAAEFWKEFDAKKAGAPK